MKSALVIVSSIGIALVAVTAIHLSGRKQPVALMPAVESIPKPRVTLTSRGEAGEIASHGGTISEMGILGLQADQNFDTALQLEPANWEAQFFKAADMSHWPLELNRGEDVIQRLSSLIDQQDTMLPQPQFARTFVLLGEQYQKMGESDHAVATWLIGAQRFPGDPELQRRIGGH